MKIEKGAAKELIYSVCPQIREIRRTYLKGKICELSVNDEFLYDRGVCGIFSGGYSQFGQDQFIWKMIFNCNKKGFFLDVGGNDPIKINNTYLFEMNGWQGLAFEPIRSLAELWALQRETECLNIAIGEDERQIEFAEFSSHEFSSVGKCMSKENIEKSSKYLVQQKTITSILKERNIRKVDFMSVDVEGYEMNVLKGIDFSFIDISCICIENNRRGTERPDLDLRRYIISKGYRLIGRLMIDDVFVKENLISKI